MRSLSPLLALPLLGACELDFTGIGDALAEGVCGGHCSAPAPAPGVAVSGTVWVGSYVAEEPEAWILVYAPPDTVAPVDSISLYYGGHYSSHFGSQPAPAVCGYVARAVSWTGSATQLERLFPASTDCQPSLLTVQGPVFRLPAYPPLDEPFVVWGEVMVQGRPAQPGEVTLVTPRRAAEGTVEQTITTGEDGIWRIEAPDGAQRYSLCRRAWAFVRSELGIEHESRLDLPSSGDCGNARRMPDIRIGSRKAAVGVVFRRPSPTSHVRVGEGAARLALLNPADSSEVGETFETYDDGSFHLWFSHEMSEPGCDWLLRAELDGRVEIRPLLPPGVTDCRPEIYHAFEFSGE